VEFEYPTNYSPTRFLITIGENTINLATLFSSKEEYSASKIGVSGIDTQECSGHKPIYPNMLLRCDPRSNANLHRTVARWDRRVD
jgi:hypothetical protein